jgi:hypothetical protein
MMCDAAWCLPLKKRKGTTWSPGIGCSDTQNHLFVSLAFSGLEKRKASTGEPTGRAKKRNQRLVVDERVLYFLIAFFFCSDMTSHQRANTAKDAWTATRSTVFPRRPATAAVLRCRPQRCPDTG